MSPPIGHLAALSATTAEISSHFHFLTTVSGINATLRAERFDERNTRSLERALDGILRFVSTD